MKRIILRPCNPPIINRFGRWTPQCGITDGKYDECCHVFRQEQERAASPDAAAEEGAR